MELDRYEPAMPLDLLVESPRNPRKRFNQLKLEELAASIKERGVREPLLARPLGDGRYELASGHRRLRGSRMAGVATAPVRIQSMDDDEFLEVLSISNLQREDIHPIEEGQGYAELLSRPGYDVASLALKLGKSESYVHQRVKLLNLEHELLKEFLEEHFSFSHALMLARLPESGQKKIAEHLYDHQGAVVSVAELRRSIERYIYLDLSKVPWDVHDAELLPGAGSCTACPKRTGFHPSLFPELSAHADYCQERSCWEKKEKALVQLRLNTVEAQTGKPPLKVSGRYEYNSQRKQKDVLYSGEWKPKQEVGKGVPQHCGHTKVAVVIELDPYSRDEFKLGQRLEVCTNQKCEIHFQRHSSLRPPSKPLTVDQQLEELRAEKDRDLEREVREKTISQFYEWITWPVSLPLLKDLLFANFEHNDVEGAINLLGLQLPAEIAADKNYNTREPKALEWLKSQIGPGSANQVAKLLVHELMMALTGSGELAIAVRHIGDQEAAAVRRAVEDEVGQRYAEREAALLNPPKPPVKIAAAKKAAAKKKAGKK